MPKIVIISNIPDLDKNLSDFVDSCDIIMRINKMENIKTKKTGTKTTHALIDICPAYLSFTKEERQHDLLARIPNLYVTALQEELTYDFLRKENLPNAECLSHEFNQKTQDFTTFGKAVSLLHNLYPKEIIHVIGSLSTKTRTDNRQDHVQSKEDSYIANLLYQNVLYPLYT